MLKRVSMYGGLAVDTVKGVFGMRTKAQKRAEREVRDAQSRQARAAEEEARLEAARRSVSGVRLRAGGRRATAFAGVETGLAPTLGG